MSVATQGSSNNTRLVLIGGVVLVLGIILVLLILRGSVGGDDDPVADGTTESDPSDSSDQTDGATESPTSASDESDLVADGEGTTARVPLPLELEDGTEAVTVRAAFARAAAALPQAGDRVVVYELASAEDADDEASDGPGPEGDAQRLLDDVEVLGVIGPRPAANDGTLTVVLAIDEGDVGGLLPVARDGHLWLTLMPGDDDVEQDTDTDTEDGA